MPLYRKIGGLHFIRIGRLQFSFCLCRKEPAKRVRKVRNPARLPKASFPTYQPAFASDSVLAAFERLESAIAAL